MGWSSLPSLHLVHAQITSIILDFTKWDKYKNLPPDPNPIIASKKESSAYR